LDNHEIAFEQKLLASETVQENNADTDTENLRSELNKILVTTLTDVQ